MKQQRTFRSCLFLLIGFVLVVTSCTTNPLTVNALCSQEISFSLPFSPTPPEGSFTVWKPIAGDYGCFSIKDWDGTHPAKVIAEDNGSGTADVTYKLYLKDAVVVANDPSPGSFTINFTHQFRSSTNPSGQNSSTRYSRYLTGAFPQTRIQNTISGTCSYDFCNPDSPSTCPAKLLPGGNPLVKVVPPPPGTFGAPGTSDGGDWANVVQGSVPYIQGTVIFTALQRNDTVKINSYLINVGNNVPKP